MAPTKKYFQSSPQSAFDFLAESPVDSALIFSPFAPPPLPKASLWRHPRLRPYLDLCEGILRDAFEVRDLFLGYAARGQPPPSWLRQQMDQDLLWVASTEEEQERFRAERERIAEEEARRAELKCQTDLVQRQQEILHLQSVVKSRDDKLAER